MRRLLATLLVSASISTVSAQDVLVGDMNGDNELTISDVTELVDAVMGKSEKRYIYSAEAFIRDNKLSGTFLIDGIENTYVNGVKDPYNRHEYVDLGLSVKWATTNLGASSPEEYGDYFAWGETKPKSRYSWDTYKYCEGSNNTLTKYCTSSTFGTVDKKTTLEKKDDAATVNWGGDWHIPTPKELKELRDNCTWTWNTNYKGTGKAGYLITSKIPGYTDKSIFLPAAGYMSNASQGNVNVLSFYWSNAIYNSASCLAQYFYVYSKEIILMTENRYYGHSIRPVCP